MITFWIFLISWTITHALFEFRFFKDKRVFDKYEDSNDPNIPAKVYYTKAIWMFSFVWLQVLGLGLQVAMGWSFLLYSIVLLLFFPIKRYHILNFTLASAIVLQSLFIR